MFKPVEEQMKLLKKGAVDIIQEEDLRKNSKNQEKKINPLRLKPDLTRLPRYSPRAYGSPAENEAFSGAGA